MTGRTAEVRTPAPVKAKRWPGTLAFIIMGVCGVTDPADPISLISLLWGILVGLILSGLYGLFLKTVLGIFNHRFLKQNDKGTLKYVVRAGKQYLFPAAVMMAVATFYLRWSTSSVFVGAGLMAVGAASAMELGKAKGKQSMVTTLMVTAVSSLFVVLWSFGQPYFFRVPALIRGGVQLVQSLMSGGGL